MFRSNMFDNDPFFASHRDHMRQIDSMFRDPFGDMMGGGGQQQMAVSDGRDHHRDRRNSQRHQQQQAQNMVVGHRGGGGFMDPFAHFDNMFSNMRSMMGQMHQAFDQPSNSGSNPNSHMFQQTSVMSFSNTGNGSPQVYQASTSTRQGPGGVKETRRTVRDSNTGVEKIAVGHHLNDQAHVIERSRNTKTGETNENQDYINLDEEEVPHFDREYQDKWRGTMRGVEDRRRADRDRHAPVDSHHHHHRAALPEPKSHRPRKTSHRRE